ncbi:hypothetical protein [Moheibacter stercoris]|uniref:Oxygen tolerance n=1 Tax=Moheibacter stercoris TaxID=1628251 RepID=A0ABV2LQ87_9FLAO
MKEVGSVGGWKLEVGKIKSFLFSLLMVFSCLISFEANAQIKAEIDTANIKIGEPIHYRISIPIQPNQRVSLPELKDTLSFHVEILDQKIDTVFENERKVLVQELTLTSFDSGEFLIRSLPIVIDSDTILSNSFTIKVEEVELNPEDMEGFPIKPIMGEEYTWKDYWDKYWMYFVAAILIFLVLLVLTILFLRNKKRSDEKSYTIKTPYEEAVDALKNLDKKKYLDKNLVNPYYSELSYLLRRYLGRVYHFSSLELLSDDLVDHFKKSDQLTSEDVQKLKEFLFDSDLVKFAKAMPEKEKHEYYRNWVADLVEKIKPLELEDDSVQEDLPNLKYRKIE